MDDLLIIELRNPKMNAASTMSEAADEIERLRSLITAWADADDAWDPPFADDVSARFACIKAADALRKAVGR